VDTSLYDSDFYECGRNSSASDSGPAASLAPAWNNVAHEIAGLGKRDRRDLFSHMTVLMHLMKWAAQPERRPGSTWKATIDEQLEQIAYILEDSQASRPA
jgi:Domain of unknown function DUF29